MLILANLKWRISSVINRGQITPINPCFNDSGLKFNITLISLQMTILNVANL